MKRFFTVTVLLLMTCLVSALAADEPLRRGLDFPYEGRVMIVNEEGKYGFADEEGNVVIPCQFDKAFPFKYGMAMVALDWKYGFIDPEGQFIIAPQYEISWAMMATGTEAFLDVTYFENGPLPFARITTDGNELTSRSKYGLLGREGEILPAVYDGVGSLGHGLASVVLDGKHGVVDLTNTVVIPLVYDSLEYFDHNAKVKTVFIAEKDGKFGLLGYDNREITPLQYDSIVFAQEGFAAVSKDGKFGFIDSAGNVAVPPRYDQAGVFYHGIGGVCMNGKWGFVNSSGEEIIPPVYDEIVVPAYPADENRITVRLGEKWSFLDDTGAAVLPPEFASISNLTTTPYLLAMKNEKYGVLDAEGHTVVPFVYDGCNAAFSGSFAMWKNGKLGIVDSSGKEVTPFIYDACNGAYAFPFMLQKDGLWGCVDAAGSTLLPFIYSHMDRSGYGDVIVMLDDKLGALRLTGEVLVPFDTYANLTPFSQGEAMGILRKPDAPPEAVGWEAYEKVYFLHPDFRPSAWAEAPLKQAKANWLLPIEWRQNTTWQEHISRADFCLLAAYLIQTKTQESFETIPITKSFSDTGLRHISAMASLGIVNGVGGNNFAPDAAISREEAAVLLQRLAAYLGVDETLPDAPYSDAADISAWAKAAVSFVTGRGIMQGIGNSAFDPQGAYTREQAVATMVQLFALP